MVEALCLPVDAVTGQAAGQSHGIHHTTGCGLTMDVGIPCGGPSTTAYYFDVMTQMCDSFVYNGCGGNSNKFKTLHECEETCSQQHITPGIIDHHNAPTISHGTGVVDHIEPIGTTNTGPLPQPEPPAIITGGPSPGVPAESDPQCIEMCQTNIAPEKCHCAEHLCDIQQCHGVEVCRLVRERGMVEALCLPVDAVTGQAAGQSHGIHHTTGCGLAMDEGIPCGGPSTTAYYFDVMTHMCDSFVYNGCGGNSNNFKTLHECEETCSQQHITPGIIDHHNAPTVSHGTGVVDHIEPISVGVVMSPPPLPVTNNDPSDCTLLCTKSLVPERCQCSDYLCEHKTCEGNTVCKLMRSGGFAEAMCVPPTTVSGPNSGRPSNGRQRQRRREGPRYYFDAETQSCTSFSFSGCGGNANRFMTRRRCETFCLETRITDGAVLRHNAPRSGLAETSGTYAINKGYRRGPRRTKIFGSDGHGHTTSITPGPSIFQLPVARTGQGSTSLQGLFQPLIRNLFGRQRYRRRRRPSYRRTTNTGTNEKNLSIILFPLTILIYLVRLVFRNECI
ncbi:papilin [Patella vulgata]|uniref:papilin n=1 Tax=Patella vulgata TaxID=6465 RepID=UPI0024A850D7|nr:papilin [Patella vulgata]